MVSGSGWWPRRAKAKKIPGSGQKQNPTSLAATSSSYESTNRNRAGEGTSTAAGKKNTIRPTYSTASKRTNQNSSTTVVHRTAKYSHDDVAACHHNPSKTVGNYWLTTDRQLGQCRDERHVSAINPGTTRERYRFQQKKLERERIFFYR